jgi:hypothetical protein
LLNLIYREQLFPRRAYQRAFEALLAGDSEKQACRTNQDGNPAPQCRSVPIQIAALYWPQKP